MALDLVKNGSVKLFKDQKDAVVFAKYLQQVYDVVVLKLFKNSYFSQRCFAYLKFEWKKAYVFVVVTFLELLDGDLLASYLVSSLKHNAVGPK